MAFYLQGGGGAGNAGFSGPRGHASRKRARLIAQAGEKGPGLWLSLKPSYPPILTGCGLCPRARMGVLADLYAELVANSVDIPGPATDRLVRGGGPGGRLRRDGL